MQRLVLILSAGLVVLALYTFQRGAQPDPSLINLAVRATVFAMPSPTAQAVEVTRVVEVTRIVEVVRFVEVTPTLLAASPSETPTPTPSLTPTAVAAVPPDAVALSAAVAAPATDVSVMQEDVTLPQPEAAAPPQNENAGVAGCPATSGNQYTSIPVTGAPSEHPDTQHGDLNLALRGYVPAEATHSLVDINGPTDGDAPQLAGVLGRLPAIERTYQVRDWNWGCGGLGCRGDLLGHVEVSLVALQSAPGEAVHLPTRGSEIYGGGYVALVLYADASRLTVVYTREDSVANGYAVHLEDFCVDPNLLALYQTNNAAGRGTLPAVYNGQPVGTARYHQVVVGVRDRGAFTDPRSRKDWWRGY